MQREQPGREVDLIAHSQGGLVIDVFLANFYRAGDRSFPPLGNVVTLSSPHEGAPLATVAQQVRATRKGKAVLDTVEDHLPLPPTDSAAVRDLAEGSSVVREVQERGVPEHFDYTTIGATEDFVVPATNISLPGATETVAAVDDLNQHSAIVRSARGAQGGARCARGSTTAVRRGAHRAALGGESGAHQPVRAHGRRRRRIRAARRTASHAVSARDRSAPVWPWWSRSPPRGSWPAPPSATPTPRTRWNGAPP